MRLFLIGFMGSGKSYVGKRLAEKMNYNFIDLDDYIIEKEGLTIPQIFEKHGENYFRERESFYLTHFFQKENTIVATGGGAPCFFDNMEKMCANGITIYLFTHPNILFERLKNERKQRPLLTDKSDDALREFITNKVNERAKYYDQAEMIVKINENNDKMIDEILEAFIE